MSDLIYPTGWIRNDAATDAFRSELESTTGTSSFSAARPKLAGYHKQHQCLPWLAEKQLFGHFLPAQNQKRGTCVWRGTVGAIERTHFHAIMTGRILAKPVRFAGEVLYAGSRTDSELGNGQLGGNNDRQDGSTDAWSAKWYHNRGLPPRGRYGQYDLTTEKEALACQWGARGVGVPRELVTASEPYKGGACFYAESEDDLIDGLAAGYCCGFCSGTGWQIPSVGDPRNVRDARGACRPVSAIQHCIGLCGFWTDAHGDACTMHQQSWGDDCPRGPNVITLQTGEQVELPPGGCQVYISDVMKAKRSGQAWLFDVLRNPVRPEVVNPGDYV